MKERRSFCDSLNDEVALITRPSVREIANGIAESGKLVDMCKIHQKGGVKVAVSKDKGKLISK